MAHSSTISSGSKIPFDTVKTNIGGGWSSATNTFTAPVKGLYFFSLGIMITYSTSSDSYAEAYIMYGNNKLRFVYARRPDNIQARIPASSSVTLILNAQDVIYAKRHSGTLYSDGTNLYTHFVGFLIQKVK